MSLFAANMIFFYVVYWLMELKKEIEPILAMYRIEKNIEDRELINTIKEDADISLMHKISKYRTEGFDGFQKIINEINEYTKLRKNLNGDIKYREMTLSKRRKSMHIKHVLKCLKVALVTFLSNLWIMTPGIVLIVLGGKYLPLLALLLTLTIYAMKREERLSNAVAYLKGEKYLEGRSIRVSIFLKSMYDATVTQWYFITYIILLYFIN